MNKLLFIAAGHISLFLGIIGIFVPLLPTTPFLLLAAACFFRGSDPLYQWITHHRLFGNYIKQYYQYRAVSKATKILALVLLWTTIGYSAAFVVPTAWLRLLILAIGIGVTVHISRLRTLGKAMAGQLK